MEKGDMESALTNLQQALKNDEDSLMANYLFAIACQKTGRENEATQYFKKVIARYNSLAQMKSRFAEGFFYMGKCYFYLGDLANALKSLEKAVEFDTEAVDYHYSFGMLYSDADAFHALAEVQNELGNTADARENLKKAIELEPDNKKYQELKMKLGI
jgi:tetratricopeptide (TPR) repeat protein